MKTILALLITIIAIGCGGSHGLTSEKIVSEQSRITSYYIGRSNGASFRQSFYLSSDSAFASLTDNDAKVLAPTYSAIAGARTGDSANTYSAGYYAHLAAELHANLSIAKGAY